MSGDYSRQRFDSKNDFSGVLQQQGRVQLDADWNEEVEILNRRWRAETTDIIGRCVVPKETPDGFKIEVSGGTFTIGRGRIYVDGLLAENHGKPPLEFDRVLAEERGTVPLSYTVQPYFPNPPSLPAGGPHLVYIDVWQREVTYLEDPGLVEQAVGVDTTTRLQTVWQVKIYSNIGTSITCNSTEKEWADWLKQNPETAPSAGRLSTGTVPVPAEKDPCQLPPTGGYRGLEHQLYRVEIHNGGNGGPGGTATFKWSRDNATVSTSVTAINGTQLTVDRTGWDAVRRFSPGDWVEITDDWREYAGQSGEIRRIQTVDDGTRMITLTAALPAGDFPTVGPDHLTDPKRHTRIRRWDQKGQVEVRDANGNLISTIDLDASSSVGVIPVPADGHSIVLENGVKVTFHTDPVGGNYRVGDYWVFYARTATSSYQPFIEELEKAPPRGIHHHYGRLAIVTFPDSETDCRVLWPPEAGEGCCVLTVGDSTHSKGQYPDVASAVRAIEGSTFPVRICLLPGIHKISQPVSIRRNDVTIIGCGKESQIVANNTAFVITGNGVILEHFTLETKTSKPAIVWTGSGGQVRALDLDSPGGPGIVTTNVDGFTALENVVAARPSMSLQGRGLLVMHNRVRREGLEIRGGSSGVRVVENLIANGEGNGITLGAMREEDSFRVLKEISLERNHITETEESGIASAPGQSMVMGLYIAENLIERCVGSKAVQRADGLPHGGIVLTGIRRLLIERNRIQQNGTRSSVPVCGIFTFRTGGLEVIDNHVMDNGMPPKEIQGRKQQGGIVALEATSVAAIRKGKKPGETSIRTLSGDGAFAARITGNVVSVSGALALYVKGLGPMKVTDNRLVSRNNLSLPKLGDLEQLLQAIANQPEMYVGSVLILNYGLPPHLASLVAGHGFTTSKISTSFSSTTGYRSGLREQAAMGGAVQFSDNQVVLEMKPDMEGFQLLGVGILTLDDLIMSANQTESRLNQCFQLYSTMDVGMTARVIANGYAEDPGRCAYSLVSLGQFMSTGTENQGTHCIVITGNTTRTVNRDNLALACTYGKVQVFGKHVIGG